MNRRRPSPSGAAWWLGLGTALGLGLGLVLRRPVPPAADTEERDQLTGLLTRQGFERQRQTLPPGPWTLALIDLNRLKAVNSLHGHSGGDRYLARTAQILRRALPVRSLLGRWGGDEFLALLPVDETASRAVLTQVSRAALHPLPGQAAFSFGLAPWAPDTPFERALVLTEHRLSVAKGALETAHPAQGSLPAFARHLEALQTPQAVIEQGLSGLRELLDFDVAQYGRYQGAALEREYVDLRAGLDLPALRLGKPTPSGALTRQALETGRTVVSADYPSHPLAAPFWVTLGAKSVLMTPVLEGERAVGLLSLVQVRHWHALTPQTQQVAELAALRLGHALEVQRLREQLTGRD